MSSTSSQMQDVDGCGSRWQTYQLDASDIPCPPNASLKVCWPRSGEQYLQPQQQLPVLQPFPAILSPQLSNLSEFAACSNDKDQRLGAGGICRAPTQQQAQQHINQGNDCVVAAQHQMKQQQEQPGPFDRAELNLLQVAIMNDATQDSMLHTVVAANTPEQLFCALDAYLGTAIDQGNCQQPQQHELQDQRSALLSEAAASPDGPSSAPPTDCQLQLLQQAADNTGSASVATHNPGSTTAPGAAANGSNQNPSILSPSITCSTRFASMGSGSTLGSTTLGDTTVGGTAHCMSPPQATRAMQQQQQLGLMHSGSSAGDLLCTAAAPVSLPMLAASVPCQVLTPSPMEFTVGNSMVPTGAFSMCNIDVDSFKQAMLLQGCFLGSLADMQQQQDGFPLQRRWSELAATAAAVPAMLAGKLAGERQQQQQSCGLKRQASEPAPFLQRQLQFSRKPRHSTLRLRKSQQPQQQQQQQPVRKRRAIGTKCSSSNSRDASHPPSPTAVAAAAAASLLRSVSAPLAACRPHISTSSSIWHQQQQQVEQAQPQQLRPAQPCVLSMAMQFMHCAD